MKTTPDAEEAVITELQQATQEIEQVVERAEIAPPAPHPSVDAGKLPAGEQSLVGELSQATQRAEEAMQRRVREKTEECPATATHATQAQSPNTPAANPTAESTPKLP